MCRDVKTDGTIYDSKKPTKRDFQRLMPLLLAHVCLGAGWKNATIGSAPSLEPRPPRLSSSQHQSFCSDSSRRKPAGTFRRMVAEFILLPWCRVTPTTPPPGNEGRRLIRPAVPRQIELMRKAYCRPDHPPPPPRVCCAGSAAEAGSTGRCQVC